MKEAPVNTTLAVGLMAVIVGCGNNLQSVAEKHKCTADQMVNVKSYVETCSQKDSYFASYCFDRAIENFCDLKDIKK